MPGELGWLSSGVVLQVVGMWLTYVGIRGALDGTRTAAALWVNRRWQRFRRALGFPGPPQVITPRTIESVSTVGRPRVTQMFAPLQAHLTPEQALRELDDRLRQVQKLAYDQADAAETRVRETVEQVRIEHQEASVVAEQEAEQDRRTTFRGLRLEAFGFFFLSAGTLSQAIGAYLGIFTDPR